MIPSLLKKILFGFLWLWVISLTAFWLSKSVPGDEVLEYLNIDDPAFNVAENPYQQRHAYEAVAHKRGLDLPPFYVSIHSGKYPESLYQILPLDDRRVVKEWIDQTRLPLPTIELYNDFRQSLNSTCGESNAGQQAYCHQVSFFLSTMSIAAVKRQVESAYRAIRANAHPDSSMLKLSASNLRLTNAVFQAVPESKKIYLPVLHWNGTHNQYHQWITRLISFQPLTSLIDGRNAWTKIMEALKWTLILNGCAFLLVLFFGTWIGIWSGRHDGTKRERWVSFMLFGFFAMPAFWLATMLILLFSSGEWLTILPSGGLGYYQAASSIVEKWGILIRHLVLPVICLSIGSLAYLSRQMKQSVLHEWSQPYVQALRTMGISEKTILRRHVVRNALFPIITLIGKEIPALLSGSLIIEVIFSIPGMGRLTYTSLVAKDWPVVFPILMLGATVTVFAYIFTDLVYKWIDPRVKSTG